VPKKSSQKTVHRFNIDLPDAVKVRLEEIRDETGASSVSEVVRRALATYDNLYTCHKAGNVAKMEDENGELRDLFIIP